ncbi:uncharacterized protein FA14DRAFT_154643 [Meira miltonrushii]|uniref:Uncharacterized protein n=1 Tax=Meira miltonrushii TaxID=1280837 RepID=A0A316VC60_9BASI|nr:uncharacterized protein FA14DRAFT_154643 [Meira miltonrushii]PWN35219.1 hypothetical protein FA14DRAFT_154643 [Meira miltonrushii]
MQIHVLLSICFIVFLAGVRAAPTSATHPPPDDYSKPKQHAALLRDGPLGTEVGLIGSSKGNSGKGYSLIRGKVQVGEKKKNTIIRELGEEAKYSEKNIHFKSDRVKSKGANGVKAEGYAIHLKAGAKQDMNGENRQLKFVHHSQVGKYLKKPEQKALYQDMQKQNLIKNRTSPPRKPLERSTSMNSATTAKTSPTRRLGRSLSGRHR